MASRSDTSAEPQTPSPPTAPPWARGVLEWLLAHVPRRRWVRIGLGGGFVIAIVLLLAAAYALPFLVQDGDAGALALGVLTIVLLGIISAGPIPIPGLKFAVTGLIFIYGAHSSPIVIGLVGGTAMVVGMTATYALGGAGLEAAGGRLTAHASLTRTVERIIRYIRERGFAAVVLLAFIPFPVGQARDAAVGASGLNFRTYVTASWLGTCARTVLIAFLGAWIIGDSI